MRDSRIDFIKGMLMWCVIYGHTINVLLSGTQHAAVWLHIFVRTFDMPFFMILSGYFLKKSLGKRCAWDVFVNRLSQILVPIAIWTLLRGHFVFVMYYFLWAILISSIVCIVGRHMVARPLGKVGMWLEFIFYIVVVVFLHVVNVPWNLFYLFPFFVMGFYMKDVQFQMSRIGFCLVAAIFVIALCFWTTSYTPWAMGAFAWKNNPTAMLIYGYRFVLGIAGVYVMAKLFDLIRVYLNNVSAFSTSVVVGWGRETLALYILQSIFVERIGGWVCHVVYKHHSVVVPQVVTNLIGYFVAPLLSASFVIGIMLMIKKIRSIKVLKYAFGFKAK